VATGCAVLVRVTRFSGRRRFEGLIVLRSRGRPANLGLVNPFAVSRAPHVANERLVEGLGEHRAHEQTHGDDRSGTTQR
jgi:hypothetical protein